MRTVRFNHRAKTSAENTEAQVKTWVKEVLVEHDIYYLMPVQMGIGATGVDFHCVVKWRGFPLAFFIETKEFGKEPTDRQTLFKEQRKEKQNAETFVIDGMVGVQKLRDWLERLKK